MIFNTVRSYIKSQIPASFSEWQDAFNLDNIPNSIIDSQYHILAASITGVDNSVEFSDDDLAISITFFKRSFSVPIEETESFVDEIFCIKNNLVDSTNWSADISRVSFNSMDISPLETNDDLIVITLNLTFNLKYCLGE